MHPIVATAIRRIYGPSVFMIEEDQFIE